MASVKIGINDPIVMQMNSIMLNDTENVPVAAPEAHSEAYLEWSTRKRTKQPTAVLHAQKNKKPPGKIEKKSCNKKPALDIPSSSNISPISPTNEDIETLWKRIISEDAVLPAAAQVLPFSDAYLSGMPTSLQLRIKKTKFSIPPKSIQDAISQAVGEKAKRVITDAVKNEDLLASLRATIHNILLERISSDTDYDPDNFVNTKVFLTSL